KIAPVMRLKRVQMAGSAPLFIVRRKRPTALSSMKKLPFPIPHRGHNLMMYMAGAVSLISSSITGIAPTGAVGHGIKRYFMNYMSVYWVVTPGCAPDYLHW